MKLDRTYHLDKDFDEPKGQEILDYWTNLQIAGPEGQEPSVEDLFVKLHDALVPA